MINNLTNGGRVANLSIATDESYIDKNTGNRVDKTEWHRVVTFQPGLVDMLIKNAKKGRLVYVAGKMQTRRWRKDGEDSDRFSSEILLVPGSRIQFLDRANGNGVPAQAGQATSGDAGTGASALVPFFFAAHLESPSRGSGGTVRAPMANAVPVATAEGDRACGKQTHSEVMSYFDTRIHSANPCGVLHCASLRYGRGSQGNGAQAGA